MCKLIFDDLLREISMKLWRNAGVRILLKELAQEDKT